MAINVSLCPCFLCGSIVLTYIHERDRGTPCQCVPAPNFVETGRHVCDRCRDIVRAQSEPLVYVAGVLRVDDFWLAPRNNPKRSLIFISEAAYRATRYWAYPPTR